MKSKKPKKTSQSEELSRIVAEGMVEKRAKDIKIIDLRSVIGSFTDFFVIATGTSDTHVDAISDSVEEIVLKKTRQLPWHREGKQNKEWILLDYVDVVVNVFRKETRQYYSLEELWADGEVITVETGE